MRVRIQSANRSLYQLIIQSEFSLQVTYSFVSIIFSLPSLVSFCFFFSFFFFIFFSNLLFLLIVFLLFLSLILFYFLFVIFLFLSFHYFFLLFLFFFFNPKVFFRLPFLLFDFHLLFCRFLLIYFQSCPYFFLPFISICFPFFSFFSFTSPYHLFVFTPLVDSLFLSFMIFLQPYFILFSLFIFSSFSTATFIINSVSFVYSFPSCKLPAAISVFFSILST